MNASSRYREVKSFILNIYCNCSKHCIKMHTDYIHKYCILLKYRYVLERHKLPLRKHKQYRIIFDLGCNELFIRRYSLFFLRIRLYFFQTYGLKIFICAVIKLRKSCRVFRKSARDIIMVTLRNTNNHTNTSTC